MLSSAGSVWAYTDRCEFESDVRKLYQQARSGPAADHNKRIRADIQYHASSDLSNGLPFSVEKGLADHFAFLTAWQTESETTATVMATTRPPGLRVTLVGDARIPSEVKAALGHISYRLQQCAQNGQNGRRSTAVESFNLGPSAVPSDKAAEQCLREVALLHRQRIFARLGSKKGVVRPTSSPPEAVVDIPNYLGKVLVQLRTRQLLTPRPRLLSLIARLERLVSSLRECETAVGELETYCLTAMLQEAHDLFEYGLPLLQELAPGCTGSLELRQLRALGYYWRMCRHLVGCATTYRKVFKSINLEMLHPLPAEVWRGLSHSVHPEVQLLVHQETHNKQTETKPRASPRYIGTSKRPCFLCHALIAASGKYGITGSRGEIDPLWTCPDLAEFSPGLRSTLGKALEHTALVTRQAVKPGTRHHVTPPLETSKAQASPKLFGEELPLHPHDSSRSSSRPRTAREATKSDSGSIGRSYTTHSKKRPKVHTFHSSEATLVATPEAIVRNLTPGKSQRVSCAKSDVYVSLEGGKGMLDKRLSQASAACSFGSSDTLYDKAHSSIDISRIMEGDEIVLAKEDLATELILELRLDRVQTCRLRLQWEAA